MFIKPVGKRIYILLHVGPAVGGAGLDDKLRRGTDRLGARHETFRLLQGDELVGVAMENQRRRQLRCDEIDWRDFFTESLTSFRSVRFRTEGWFEIL
jgi:hypothetical protein